MGQLAAYICPFLMVQLLLVQVDALTEELESSREANNAAQVLQVSGNW